MLPPENLNAAEQRLRDTVFAGEPLDLRTGHPAQDDPANGADWGKDRNLRASVIRAVCLSIWGVQIPDPKGIMIAGPHGESRSTFP